MFNRLIGLVLVIGSILGCATGPKLSDEQIIGYAGRAALIESCSNKEILPKNLTINHGYALTNYLDIFSYNKKLYKDSYEKAFSIAENNNSDLLDYCNENGPNISGYTTWFVNYINQYRRQESAALAQFAATIQAIGNDSQAHGQKAWNTVNSYQPTPITFGQSNQQKSGYTHYLINTPSGQKQCHTSSTGYVFCN